MYIKKPNHGNLVFLCKGISTRPSQADDCLVHLSHHESQFDLWTEVLYCILEKEAYSHNVSL